VINQSSFVIVPDTVASMAVAKHGEGPSSIANAIGSQVLNINLGIGLPFLVSNIIRGSPVQLMPSSDSGMLVLGTVVLFMLLVLLERVVLKTRDAILLAAAYLFVVFTFGLYSGSMRAKVG
jgi:Ca2+/Na+ antiporter